MRSNAYYGPTWHSWESRVTVAWIETDLVSWEIDRPLTGMPQVRGSGSEANGATGKLVPVHDRDILEYAPHPWVRSGIFPPRPGWPVQIDVRPKPRSRDDAQAGEWVRVFTGVVDSVDGDDLANIEVQIVDQLDPFTRPVSLPPMQHNAPNLVSDGELGDDAPALRPTGLHIAHHINAAFEVAGYSCALPPQWEGILRAPLVGSLYPLVGDLGGVSTPSGATINAKVSEWGYGLGGFVAKYSPTSLSDDLHTITIRIPWTVIGSWTYSLYRLKDQVVTNTIIIEVSPEGTTRRPTVKVTSVDNATGVSFSSTEIGTLFRVTVQANGTAVARSHPDGAWDEVVKQFTTTPGGTFLVGVGSTNSNSTVGGFMLENGIGVNKNLRWEPTGVINYSGWLPSALNASRPVMGVQAKTLLDDIADAHVAHWGIDEEGRATFTTLFDAIRTTTPRATVTDDDVLDRFGWRAEALAEASMVTTESLVPGIRVSPTCNVRVYQGDQQTLQSGTTEEFIHSPELEDWIQVDARGESGMWMDGRVIGWSSREGLDRSRFIAIKGDGNDTNPGPASWSEYEAFGEELDYKSWKITHKVNVGSGQVTTRTGNWTELHPSLRNRGTPIINAYGRVLWREVVESTTPKPNSWAGAYILKCGAWSYPLRASYRNQLAELLGQEQVLFKELDIQPDMRLQNGDTIRLDFNRTQKLQADVVVTRTRLSHNATEGFQQTIDVRSLRGATPGATYSMLEDVYRLPGSDKYSSMEYRWRNQNYSDMETLPLS